MTVRSETDPKAVAESVGAVPRHTYSSVLRGFAATLNGTQRRKLAGDERVASVTDDGASRRSRPRKVTLRQPVTAQIIPSGVERVGALDSSTAGIDGEDEPLDADVAVLDSGVTDHPDLFRAGGVDCVSGGRFDDHDGHGTMAAGIIGARDNGRGVVGVAPGARIWAVRVIDSVGKVTDSAFLCGLDWVHRHAAAIDVVNMSFSGGGIHSETCGVIDHQPIDPLHVGICRLVQAGIVVVVSAGNQSVDAATTTPAAYPEVIAVSAFGETDGRAGGRGRPARCESGPAYRDDWFAPFSNYGAVVDVAAPGVCVISTFPSRVPDRPAACTEACYARATGTSFAAPHVAGAAALVRVRHPEWTPAEVRQHIIDTAEPGPIPGDPDNFPEGILNIRGT